MEAVFPVAVLAEVAEGAGKMNIFAVYKPKGPTSHDVVNAVRRATGEKRVGHAGTLDPLARGVLVVAVGRDATKQLASIVAKEKEYIADICLGMTSTTDDEEGEKTPVTSPHPSRETVEKIVQVYYGEILQTPPAFSAIKLKGQKAYERARKGKEVHLEPRRVTINEIEILAFAWPHLRLRVVTGPGVYIRALARDIGSDLGCGAYLADLERTRVGAFTKEGAVPLSNLSGSEPAKVA